MKPRSRTGTFASSGGRNSPFRKTMLMLVSWCQLRLLEPQPECIPRPAEDAGHRHGLQGHDRVFGERLAVESHTQCAHALALRHRRKQRLLGEQIRLQLVGLTPRHGHEESAREAGLHRSLRAVVGLELLYLGAAVMQLERVEE